MCLITADGHILYELEFKNTKWHTSYFLYFRHVYQLHFVFQIDSTCNLFCILCTYLKHFQQRTINEHGKLTVFKADFYRFQFFFFSFQIHVFVLYCYPYNIRPGLSTHLESNTLKKYFDLQRILWLFWTIPIWYAIFFNFFSHVTRTSRSAVHIFSV